MPTTNFNYKVTITKFPTKTQKQNMSNTAVLAMVKIFDLSWFPQITFSLTLV